MKLVLTVQADGRERAYDIRALKDVPVNDLIGETAVVVFSQRKKSIVSGASGPFLMFRTFSSMRSMLRVPIMAISVAGGDLQDQLTLNLLLDVIEFDMLPEAAVTAPRSGAGQEMNA